MGRRSFERWPNEEWRRSAPTVVKMGEFRWEVQTYCRARLLVMATDLELIEHTRGPETVLWKRQTKCRRKGCAGTVEFQGGPRELQPNGPWLRLFAAWLE